MKKCLFAFLVFGIIPASFATPVQLVNSYSQDFDSLGSSGTNSLLPVGWAFHEDGSSANNTYSAGTGSSTTGNTYSFGATDSSERALGGLRSGGVIPMFGVEVQNASLGMISSLTVAYTGEQWRVGKSARLDQLMFQYSLDATSLNTGTWISTINLDFLAPVTDPVGSLDGNLAVNQSDISAVLSGLNFLPDSTIWMRWIDLDATGADDGLAIDNFSIVATSPAAPASVPESLPAGFDSLALCGALFFSRKVFLRTQNP